MNSKRFFLLILSCAGIIVLIYLCKMLSPLLDDVWKILIAGVPVGFAMGFWSGFKWKTFELEEKKNLLKDKEKFEAEKNKFDQRGKI